MSLQTTSNLTLSIKGSRPAHRAEMANPESTVTTAIGTVRWFQLASALHRKDPELDTACWADTVSKDLRTITAGGAVSQHKPVADLADAISVLREFSSVLSSSK